MQANSVHKLTRREMLALSGGAFTVFKASCTKPDQEPQSTGASGGPFHYMSLLDVARLIETGELSPAELVEEMLERIDEVDSRLHSYATVTADLARTQAREAEDEIRNGNYRGPLHGIPVAVKDLCYTKGVRTMGGLGVLADFVPEYDATVVTKLQEAGAVLLGKLSLTEGAMGGYHPDFNIPVNPWGDALWSGASSSGSGVATSAGLCFASLGSDTGGSIRFPSMANGIVGLKPTYGRVSRHGVLALAETLDHVGPMTRRVADAAVVLEAIAGADPNDATSLQEPVPNMLEEIAKGVGGLRVGFDRAYASDVGDGLFSSLERALEVFEELGATIVDVEVPEFTSQEQDDWFSICAFEAHEAHQANYPSRVDEYGPYFRDFLALGADQTEAAYAAATDRRNAFSARYRDALRSVDAVVASSGGSPFDAPHEILYGDLDGFDPLMPNVQFQFTAPADFAGTPGLALPCGQSPSGVPYTMQLLGERLTEPVLCRLGHAFEEATAWHELVPPV